MQRDRFVQICRIVRENETIGCLEITPNQRLVLQACMDHRWVMVKKYRQAKITTLMILDLLGQCMYSPGVQGVLIAEKYDTAETAWGCARYAYDYLPDAIKIPSRSGRDPAKRELEFTHGGRIKAITAATGAFTNTVVLKNGANAVSSVMSFATQPRGTVVNTTLVDDTYSTFNAGVSATLTVTKLGGNAEFAVVVTLVRVA